MRPFRPPLFGEAPIRASHLIQLDYYTDTRNFIHMWLPESYGGSFLLARTEDRRFHTEGDTLVTTFEMPDRFRLRGEVYPIEDGVGLRLAVTNVGSAELPAGPAGVCIQFAAAPSFADSALERYFYVAGGEIVFVKPPFANNENYVWFYGTAPSPQFIHNPEPDYPFIGLASKDGRWAAGHAFDTARGIGGNCHPCISCLHAGPNFDAIEPGQTAVSEGVLYLMPGSAADCAARFEREFRCG
ncbi:MAG TPA: hypothetical protein VM221_01955 [Armatimonadota bacterium]|nr:hypothetical protein [Armatimonadota bacterium]